MNLKCGSQDKKVNLQDIGISTIPNICRTYYEGRLISRHGQEVRQNERDNRDLKISNAELKLEKLLGGEKDILKDLIQNNYGARKFNLFNKVRDLQRVRRNNNKKILVLILTIISITTLTGTAIKLARKK